MTGDAGQSLGLSIWSTLILAGIVLLSRRATGALTTPLPPLMLTFLTAAVATLSLIAYACVCRQQPVGTGRRILACGVSWTAAILPTLGVAPRSLVIAGVVLSLLFLLLGSALYRVMERDRSLASRQATQPDRLIDRADENRDPPRLDDAVAHTAVDLDQHCAALPVDPESDHAESDHIVQRLTRSLEEGVDVLEGTIRVDFVAGQKLAVVHIPFWPAFSSTPRVACEATDCRARVAVVHVYGTRIEVKRPTDSVPKRMWLDICATADESERMAA